LLTHDYLDGEVGLCRIFGIIMRATNWHSNDCPC